MEKEELKEISGGTYYVEGNSTIKKGSGKIFDFYIKELCFYSRLGNDIAFEMTLENEEKKISEMFPISYLYDPESWYDHGFKYEDFQRNCTTKEFESSMIEIINLIIKHEKYKAEEVFMGWNLKKVISEEKLRKRTLYLFGKFGKPEKLIKLKEYKNKPKNYVFEYLKFADISIAGPLMSYMLLSLFTSLRFMGVDARPDFNVALVGGDPETRRKTALFFTNLYKRDPHFYKTDYKFFHIMQDDSASDIRFKSAMVRDCVLIAFEPDKRHMKTLLGEVYKTNTIYKKRPIENLLLFTCEKLEKTTPGNTLIIKLDDSHDMSLVKQHFGVDVIRSNEGFLEDDPFGSKKDFLLKSIYYYISFLTRRLLWNKNFLFEQYLKHQQKIKEQYQNLKISHTAEEVIGFLTFAFELYAKYYDAQDEEICKAVNESIVKAAINSFPLEGCATDDDFEEAKVVCQHIDSYFENERNSELVGKIGCEENGAEKRVWYDDETIYIRRKCVSEFLQLTKSETAFGKKINIVLADKKIIKVIVKRDNKPEYSVHIQKRLYYDPKDKTPKNAKSKLRYIAFSREICCQYDLLKNIEKICKTKDSRCQIDVKTQKNKETEDE